MNQTKNIISILFVLILAACCCACSKNNESEVSTMQLVTSETKADAATEEPSEPPTDLIDEAVAGMTVEEKVGQMFLARCPDTDAAETVSTYHLGGYILFGRDFADKTAEEIKADIESYQKEAKIPLFIGVDEEGGTVVRVSDNPELRYTAFLSPKDNFDGGGWEQVESAEAEKADLLLSLGINVNFAPVCDVTSNADSFMYLRSFSDNADEVSDFVRRTVAIYSEKGLGSVLKHFPGYGDNVDTHEGMAFDSREYAEFVNKDFKPFEAGIKAGADCILVAHNIVSSMDSEYPASLSEKVHQIIRNDLGFDGVIMTDDLVMEAITQYTGAESSAVFAAKCGNDILCCTDLDAQYPAVLQAVQDGEIPEEQIDQSVKRILKWKQKLGIYPYS